jgi:UDP-N-acetylmuramate--alanine ligase
LKKVDSLEYDLFMEFNEALRPGARVYFVGIKGTGMCALAELILDSGASVSGSDTDEVFYTDGILKELNIPFYETFDASHITGDIDIVIHSAAYEAGVNPELAEAARLGIPILKYTDALGLYSKNFNSSGIAGVHGKTTTTAIAGTLIAAAGLPARILAGSAVANFNGRSTLNMGSTYFIAETCEYRRNFLAFHPRRIVLTGVESDHQDYFPTYESIRDAFLEYCRLLPADGELVYCADDPGAAEVASALAKERRGISLTPYGFAADGEFRIEEYRVEHEAAKMIIAGFPGELTLKIPGRHIALDAAGALALTSSLVGSEFGNNDNPGWDEERRENVRKALEGFRGSKRRQEILGETGGILFMDDYAHHPTAIAATLDGLKAFYPDRRIVVSFMSHTYTRTAALLDEFAFSFEKADVVFLHKIYASAREQYTGGVNGRTLFEKTKSLRKEVYYAEEPLDAIPALNDLLGAGDLFITMGAGNNWVLGKELYSMRKGKAA